MEEVFPWHTQDKVTKGQGIKGHVLIQSFLREVIKKKKRSPIKTEMGLCKLEYVSWVRSSLTGWQKSYCQVKTCASSQIRHTSVSKQYTAVFNEAIPKPSSLKIFFGLLKRTPLFLILLTGYISIWCFLLCQETFCWNSHRYLKQTLLSSSWPEISFNSYVHHTTNICKIIHNSWDKQDF